MNTFYAPDGELPGSAADVLAKVLTEVHKVSTGNVERDAEITALKVQSAKLGTDLADMETRHAKANAELAVVKAALADSHGGPSGAADWLNETGKWLRGIYAEQRQNRPSTEKFRNGQGVSEVIKATTDFSTTTGATAGYLLPTLLRPGFVQLKDIYGNFYPKVTKFNSPPGQSVVVNDQAAAGNATWRSGQNTALAQADPNLRLYNDDTLVPELLYVYEMISNEMVTNPAINFAAVSVVAAAKAVNTALEVAMISAASAPHAGISTVATAAASPIGSATLALVGTFVKAAIAANSYMGDTTTNCIFLHPRDAITLTLQSVSDANLPGLLFWGDPVTGRPAQLLGYELIVHPACKLSTTYSVLLGDPAKVILAEGPSYVADFSDQVSFAKFQTAMRVGNHYDYVVKHATEWYKATVTA